MIDNHLTAWYIISVGNTESIQNKASEETEMAGKGTYKDYWAYKEVAKNWKSKVTKTRVTIFFEDGDIYADFKLKKCDNFYLIYCDGQLINDEVDFYDTYDEAVKSCFYYFHTRF